MPRAGSTLQYNLVRLLGERYLGGISGGWVESYDALAERFGDYCRPDARPRRPLLVRTHEFDARYAGLIDASPCRPPSTNRSRVFYIYRDLRDALVSYTRRFGGTLEENIARWAERWVDWAEQWGSLANVTISRYESLMREPRRELRRYARALGIRPGDKDIEEILEACSSGRMQERASALEPERRGAYDPEYLVHPGHITDGRWGQWQRDMTPAQREAVWGRAGLWLEEHGYPRHGQSLTEPIPAEVAQTPYVDLAPPGVPKLRPAKDPLVVAFGQALVAPIWPRSSRDPGAEGEARTFYGDTLSVLPDEMVSNELAARGYFEEGLTWGLLQCLRPGDTFLDVGAHVGYFTLLGAHLVGSTGRVEAFEPTPQTAELLRSNVRGVAQVGVNELAVFSRSGPLRFHILGNEYAAYNSIHTPRLEGAEALTPARQVTVQATTLDEFCQERRLNPDFIKIDAESTELDVLRGGVQVLKRAQPIVSVEVGDCGVPEAACSREVLEFAAGLGYRVYEYKTFGQFLPHEPRRCYSYDNLLLLPPRRWQCRDGSDWPPGLREQMAYQALGRQAYTISGLRGENARLEVHRRTERARYHKLEEQHRRERRRAAVLHREFALTAWERLGRRYQTVVLFGAGKYARWLVSQVASGGGGPKIARVLDDAAKPGDTVGLIAVVRPVRAGLCGAEAVVVATDVPDSPLHRRCVETCAPCVPVVNLYQGIGTGPFPKEEAAGT